MEKGREKKEAPAEAAGTVAAGDKASTRRGNGPAGMTAKAQAAQAASGRGPAAARAKVVAEAGGKIDNRSIENGKEGFERDPLFLSPPLRRFSAFPLSSPCFFYRFK